MANLTMAMNEWMNRPADERFDSLEALLRYTERQRRHSIVRETSLNDLRVMNEGGTLRLGGKKNGRHVDMTSWAFDQLATRIGIGASQMRKAAEWGKMDAVAEIMNAGLERVEHVNGDPMASIMVEDRGIPLVRSINGIGYGRIWNADIVRNMIMPLQQDNWRTPPARPAFDGQPGTRPATEADVMVYGDGDAGMGLSVKVGDLIAPAGLYAGVEDMWVIQVNTDRRIETGAGQGLYRALVFINSEVGKAKYRVIAIGFDSICGNHIMWGSRVLGEVAIIHRGDKVTERASLETARAAQRFLDMPSSVEERAIEAARTFSLGRTQEQVVNTLFAKRIAPRKTLDAAWKKAVEFESDHRADPGTAWGMASGLTRVSQDDQYANGRAATDAAASKVLALSF